MIKKKRLILVGSMTALKFVSFVLAVLMIGSSISVLSYGLNDIGNGDEGDPYLLDWDDDDPTLVSLELVNGPTKTQYMLGEPLEIAGLELKARYSDGSLVLVESGYTVSGYNSTIAGEQVLTVEYGGKTVSFSVTVVSLTVVSIEVLTAPDKTDYGIGEEFISEGLTIRVHYSDNTSETLSEGFSCSGFSSDVEGEVAITVTYEGHTDSFIVTVHGVIVEEIAIETYPDKSVYEIGEELDPTGLTIWVLYSNGVETIIDEGFEISGLPAATAGRKTVTVSFGGKTTTFRVQVNEPVLVSVEILTMPDKTVYEIGEEFESDGLSIKANYSNNTSVTVTEGLSFGGFSSETEGEKTIVVTYEDQIASFTVTVNPLTVMSIEVLTMPGKTVYEIGEEFDSSGLTIAVYFSNHTNETLTEGFEFYGFSSEQDGEITIVVTYEEQTASFAVTINPLTITFIEIETLPDKTEYRVGEEFDGSGLTITVHYSNRTTETLDSGFSVSGFDSSTVGSKNINVLYEEHTASFVVFVNRRPASPDEPQLVVDNARVNIRNGVETFSVNITIKNNPGLNFISVFIDYNSDVMHLINVQPGSEVTNCSFGINPPYLTLFSDEDLLVDTIVFVLTFETTVNITPGTYAIDLYYEEGDISNMNEEDVEMAVMPGELTAFDYLPGDINGDGKVNGKDLTRLLKYINHQDVEVIEAALDVNGDGKVNGKDLTRLLKYINHQDVVIY